MSKKYKVEFFQSAAGNDTGGTNISSAYKKGDSIKGLVSAPPPPPSGVAAANAVVSNSSNSEPITSGPQGSGIDNLWKFLGIDSLSMKQKQCTYNCGIDSLGCMERCSNPKCNQQDGITYEQCKYGCLRKGISCSTSCISDIEPPPPPPSETSSTTQTFTTSALATEPVSLPTCPPSYTIEPTEVHGVYETIDSYSPYDMRVWPQHGMYGWTISEINRMKHSGYDSPNVIEVSMDHSLYPLKTDNPSLLFDKEKLKQVQFT